MPPWLRVAVVLATVMCALVAVVALAAEEESKIEFIAVHRTLPARVHNQNHHHEEEGEKPKLQWRFNPFNPFQTFVVSKDGHRHKKCGLAAKLASWFPNVFGRPRYFGHRHHHHVEVEKEKEEEKIVGRPFVTFGRHHTWLPFRTENPEHHHHEHGEFHNLGEDKEHQLKRHRKGSWNKIKGFFSDMSDQLVSFIWSPGLSLSLTVILQCHSMLKMSRCDRFCRSCNRKNLFVESCLTAMSPRFAAKFA